MQYFQPNFKNVNIENSLLNELTQTMTWNQYPCQETEYY